MSRMAGRSQARINFHSFEVFTMIHMFRWTILALVPLILGVAARESSAQSVAYRTHGTGLYSPFAGNYEGPGVGTHLGRHTFVGNVATMFVGVMPDGSLLFEFEISEDDPQLTVAADGSTLLFSASGHVLMMAIDDEFYTAVWEGDFVVEGGTGRFANARPAEEPLRVVAINDPFRLTDPAWPFTWELTGRIRLR
jgi:hypothetical protein